MKHWNRNLVAVALLLNKLPYDAERDFTAISLTVVLPLLLAVHPSAPARKCAATHLETRLKFIK